jgi:hypothetical protein
MKRVISEHWLGVTAGMAFLAIGLASLFVLFGDNWQSNYVGSLDEVFAGYSQNEPVYPALELALPAPPPPAPSAAEVVPAAEVARAAEVATEHETAAPSATANPPYDIEHTATAVVENPYGPGTGDSWFDLVLLLRAVALLLVFPMLCGAVAARVGPSVVPWRGAVAMATGIAVIIVAAGESSIPAFAIGMLIAAALGYAGGGLVKFLTRARLHAA